MEPNRISRITHPLIRCLVPIQNPPMEEQENLVSHLNLSVPISYPSISEPMDPPQASPQSQTLSYTNPTHTSGMATIQPPEQITLTREGPTSSAPPSGTIFSVNQPERSYLQPPAWNPPHSETSQVQYSYENPPQYGENAQWNDNLLWATRLHLGELGYRDLIQQNSLDIFRILWSVVWSYDDRHLPHSVIARIELPGMWGHTRMLQNQWLQTSATRQITNTVPSPQTQPPVSNLEVPPLSLRFLQSTPLLTSPKANKSSTPLC